MSIKRKIIFSEKINFFEKCVDKNTFMLYNNEADLMRQQK